MPDLSRIGDREKLKPKAGDEPHWQRLRQGCYLGYRPSKKMAGGTWFARVYDPETNRNSRKRLEAAPALVTRNKDGEKRTKERSKSTVNPLKKGRG